MTPLSPLPVSTAPLDSDPNCQLSYVWRTSTYFSPYVFFVIRSSRSCILEASFVLEVFISLSYVFIHCDPTITDGLKRHESKKTPGQRGLGAGKKGRRTGGGIRSILFNLNAEHAMKTKKRCNRGVFPAPGAFCCSFLGRPPAAVLQLCPCLISIFGSPTIQLDRHSLTMDSRLEMALTAGPQIPRPGSLQPCSLVQP